MGHFRIKKLMLLVAITLLYLNRIQGMEEYQDIEKIEDEQKIMHQAQVIETEPPECIICYDSFPVMQKYVCGHEICLLCYEKILNANEENYKKCSLCRKIYTGQPNDYQTIVYDIIPLEINEENIQNFQKVFPFVCKSGNLKIVKNWLALGLNPEEEGIFSYFPVHLCSTKELLDYFEKELKVNMFVTKKRNMHNVTGLYYSSELGYLDAVKYWFEKGVNVDEKYKNDNGATALMIATKNGHFEVVKYLVEIAKADVNLSNVHGAKTILFSSDLDIFKYLCKKTDKITKQDLEMSLCVKAETGHLNLVKYLVEECGVDKNALYGGITAFIGAASNGQMNIMKYLIQKKANLFKKISYAPTALEFAKYNGHSEVFKFLLKVINENNFCAVCQDWAHNRCTGCKKIYYCGKEHQADHWKRIHKNECKKKTVLQKNSSWSRMYDPRRISVLLIIFSFIFVYISIFTAKE